MAARSRRKTRRRKTRAKSNTSRGWLRWILLPAVALCLGLMLYSLYLDQVVQVRFEGKRWSLPARVYARPLELYVGLAMRPETLKRELDTLGYERSRHPNRPGSYSYHKSRFLIRTRGFRFHDGREASRYLELKFADGRLETLRPAGGGEALDLLRLDPVLIDTIYPAHHEDRILVKRAEIPELLVRALLAVEDRDFLRHHGVNPLAIARALWRNLMAGRVVQGGSTLTQQLVKNFYLSSERSLLRKFNEAIMALALDRRYSKDAILEAYANEIYLGQDGKRSIHGFGLASRFYFNRDLHQLDLPRTALLIGMIKGPSYYNPRRHPKRAKKRRNLVLDLMAGEGVISKAEAERAKAASLGLGSKGGVPAGRYPAFMQLVRKQLQRDYQAADLNTEGLSIFTTLDPRLQSLSRQSVQRRLRLMEKSAKSKHLQAAVVVASADSGEVLALVGDRKAGYSGFNRALDAVRPIGSLVKPLVYLQALESGGYTPISLLRDEAVKLKGAKGQTWQPRNFDGKTHGRVPMFSALARSYNLASVNLGMELGLERVIRGLKRLGVERDMHPLPSLLLGSLSMTPLEVTQVYQGLAAAGFRAPLRAVRAVIDARGQRLKRYPLAVRQVADPTAVYQLGWMMQQVISQGTGGGLKSLLPPGLSLAGKTGTTNDYRDSWFAGYSADKLAVVWVGRDDNAPSGLTGASGAMRVWGDIMADGDSRSLQLAPPADIRLTWIDPAGGLLADQHCPGALQVPLVAGTEPSKKAACAGGGEDPVSNFFQRFFD